MSEIKFKFSTTSNVIKFSAKGPIISPATKYPVTFGSLNFADIMLNNNPANIIIDKLNNILTKILPLFKHENRLEYSQLE